MKKLLKGFLMGLGALVLLGIIIGACSGGEETTVTEPAEKTTKEEPKVLPTIGEELVVGEVAFKVTAVNTAKSVGEYLVENAQGTYLILDVEVTNRGSESITTDSSFFKLKANGKTYESDSNAGISANEATDFFYTSINPDLSLTGKVVFDVSDEVLNSEQIIEVQTGFWGTEVGEIKIK